MAIDKLAAVKWTLNFCFDVAYVLLAVRILAPELMDVDLDITFPRIALFIGSAIVLGLLRGLGNAALKDATRGVQQK